MDRNNSALIVAAVGRAVRLSTRHAWLVIPGFLIVARFRRRLSLAPHRHQHRQQQAPVELAPLAPAGDAAQRAFPAADRPDHRRRRRDDAGGSRGGSRGAGRCARAPVGRDPHRDPAGRRRVLRPQRHSLQVRRRSAKRYGAADQGRALPRHARRRSDPARRPRRDLAIDRGRAAGKDDARRHEAGGDRDRRRPGGRRTGQASGLFLAPADHGPCAGALRASAVRQHPADPQLRRFAAGRPGDQGHPRDDRQIGPDAGKWRQGAPHRIGRACGRGIRHRRRRRRPERRRDDPRRSPAAVARAQAGPDRARGPRQPRRRADAHRGDRAYGWSEP